MNPALLVSIIVVIVGALGSIAVAIIRKPVAVQDLWTENRLLRNDLTQRDTRQAETETRYEERDRGRLRTIGVLATAVDMLMHHLDDLYEQWGRDPRPELSEEERAVVSQAREIPPPILSNT